MRNYGAILEAVQDETLSEFDIFNRTGGAKNSDPAEAIATLKAIKLYKTNTEFAKAVSTLIHGEKENN